MPDHHPDDAPLHSLEELKKKPEDLSMKLSVSAYILGETAYKYLITLTSPQK